MAEKEGESYLDQLLNNASTSSQEAGVEQVKENAGKAEQSVASAFSDYKQQVLDQLKSTMEDANAAFYTDLPREQQAYLSYIVNDILTQNGVLDQNAIDTSDATYKNWKEDRYFRITEVCR